MPFEQFLDLTPFEFYEALREREDHEDQLTLAYVRTICETVRLQTYHLVNIQLPKGKKISNVKKLMLFKWEKEPQPAQTQDQMKAIMKALAKGLSNRKNKKDGKNRRNVRR
jgi:hypothetical protein